MLCKRNKISHSKSCFFLSLLTKPDNRLFFWGAVSSKLNIYPEAVGSKSKKVQTFLKQVYANWKFFNHKQLQFLGFLLTDCKVKLGFEIYSGVGNKIEKLGP